MTQVPRLLIACLVLFVPFAGNAAMASPWPRAPETVFLSISTERDGGGNSHTGLYGEYGLDARRTLGFELSHTNVGESSGMVWLQYARDNGGGPNRWVASLGLGAVGHDGRIDPVGQIAAGWGRGIQTPLGGGWITVETRLKLAAITEEVEDKEEEFVVYEGDALTYLTPKITAKLDATLGVRPRDDLMLIGQLRLENRDDTGFSGKLAVSAVRDLPGSAKLELGLVAPVAGSGEVALRIGTWLEF